MNDKEIESMLRIMLSATEKQLQTATTETMRMYLNGYIAAVKLMLEYVEKK